MPDQVYLEPGATSAEYIKVGNTCYRLVGTCANDPNTSSFDVVEDCASCNSACPCGYWSMYVNVPAEQTGTGMPDFGTVVILICLLQFGGNNNYSTGTNPLVMPQGTIVSAYANAGGGLTTASLTISFSEGPSSGTVKNDADPASPWGTYADIPATSDNGNISVTSIVATQAASCFYCGSTGTPIGVGPAFPADCPSAIAVDLSGLPTVAGYNGNGPYSLANNGCDDYGCGYSYSDANISIALSCNRYNAGVYLLLWVVTVEYLGTPAYDDAYYGPYRQVADGRNLITATCEPQVPIYLADINNNPAGQATFS